MLIVRRELKLVPAIVAAAKATAPEAAPAEAAAPTAEAKPASRVRTFVASTESVDSYNTVIKADGWVLDRYQRNPVVPIFHNYYRFPVGIGRAYVDMAKKELKLDVDFAPPDDPVSGPDAEQALRWIDRGVLGVSVGFNPLESVYNEERESEDPWENLFFPPLDYIRAELLEVSIVMIPANADALAEGREHRELVKRAAPHLLERLRAPVAPPAPPELSKDDVTRMVRDALKTHRAAIQARRTGSLG